MVGAVLVYQGRIIGEGWHKAYGAHAEVEAIERCWEPDKISAYTLCELRALQSLRKNTPLYRIDPKT